MTKRLYLFDSHQKECLARVTSCEKADGGYTVRLDQTVLFPNAGGQPCDLGTIGSANVLAVNEAAGDLVNLTDRPLPVGETVPVRLDWTRRFDFMQQHTGEHLLSFVAFDRFGAVNVGFHLAAQYTTIDLDRPLSPEQLTALFQITNALLAEDLAVTGTLYDSEEALAALPLRKHAEGLTAPIRIVSIAGADCCTCCAPHCKQTGEVGAIVLTDAIAYKGGMRLTFLCGKRASDYAAWAHGSLERIGRRFSTGRDNAENAVSKMLDENAALRGRCRALTDRLNAYVAEELIRGAEQLKKGELIVAAPDGCDASQLKSLAPLLAKETRLCCLFAKEGDKLRYLLSSGEKVPLDMGELCQAVNAITGGKGGGRGTRAEGMASAAALTAETLAQLHAYLASRLK